MTPQAARVGAAVAAAIDSLDFSDLPSASASHPTVTPFRLPKAGSPEAARVQELAALLDAKQAARGLAPAGSARPLASTATPAARTGPAHAAEPLGALGRGPRTELGALPVIIAPPSTGARAGWDAEDERIAAYAESQGFNAEQFVAQYRANWPRKKGAVSAASLSLGARQTAARLGVTPETFAAHHNALHRLT